MSATLLPSPCKRTTGRPSPPPRRPLHALCKECDGRKPANNNHHSGFNPRTPCRVRLQAAMCDVLRLPFQSTRTPCGVRPKSARAGRTSWGFQSTHSLRSATKGGFNVPWEHVVSIHALLAECDHAKRFLASCGISFNPRTPCGVRQVCEGRFKVPGEFQSTHSLRSATRIRSQQRGQGTVSIHALLAECDVIRGKR